MSYVIGFNEKTEKFVMDGREEPWLGEHLGQIAKREGFTKEINSAYSESHALAILRANGVEIELIDID